jgi:hypothetical protein
MDSQSCCCDPERLAVIVARIVEETSGCHAMPVPCPAATPARDIAARMPAAYLDDRPGGHSRAASRATCDGGAQDSLSCWSGSRCACV